MSTSAARPDDLIAYTTRIRPFHQEAAQAIRALRRPIEALQASSGTLLRSAGLETLVDELAASTEPGWALDEWVEKIGKGFLKADTGVVTETGVTWASDLTLAGSPAACPPWKVKGAARRAVRPS